jgi:dihydroneopterin aldolase
MDKLILHQLKAAARLGVTAAERAAPQLVWIDLEVAIDAAKAAASDDVRHAVDYAQLAAQVRQTAAARPYALLETLAEAVAATAGALARARVIVRVSKRALADLDYAAVEVDRPGP